MLFPLKMAKRRLNTEKKLFWNGVTDVLHQAVANEVTASLSLLIRLAHPHAVPSQARAACTDAHTTTALTPSS